jgi:riboflavin biosynthesis pyrimidine reductase
VLIGGGASISAQYLAAGLVDELILHVAPLLLGGGSRLFEGAGTGELECTQVLESPRTTHLRYRPER